MRDEPLGPLNIEVKYIGTAYGVSSKEVESLEMAKKEAKLSRWFKIFYS